MENPKKGSLFEGKLFYVLGPKADEWTQKIKAAGGKVLQVVKKNKNQIAILPIETEFQLAQDLRRRLETAQAKMIQVTWVEECLRDNELKDLKDYKWVQVSSSGSSSEDQPSTSAPSKKRKRSNNQQGEGSLSIAIANAKIDNLRQITVEGLERVNARLDKDCQFLLNTPKQAGTALRLFFRHRRKPTDVKKFLQNKFLLHCKLQILDNHELNSLADRWRHIKTDWRRCVADILRAELDAQKPKLSDPETRKVNVLDFAFFFFQNW